MSTKDSPEADEGEAGDTSRVDPLATLACSPTCALTQPDGVPCEELGRDCARCQAFFEHRDRMRAREGPL